MARKHASRVRICEWCGNFIGAERGPAAKTCSPECERDRNAARERARYQRVRNTDLWRSVRAGYLQRLRARAAADPEFAERIAQAHREAVRRSEARLHKRSHDRS